MKIIIRHAPPSILDEADKGTYCHVINVMNMVVEEYIQRSDDPEKPRWEKI
jgi:hypothetical protein